MYRVIDVETGVDHGSYETLEDAYGCILFDYLVDWEIWKDDFCIDYPQMQLTHDT